MLIQMTAQEERSHRAVQDPLLKPFRLKRLTLKNRIMSTSHACGLEVDGFPTEAYQLYHEEKAKGGIALSMFGGSSNVAPDSPNVFRQLNVGVDGIIPHLRQFSERMHRHGAALMCQITHLGRRGEPYAGNWLPTIGPSPIRETLHRSFPKEMDRYDIERVVKAFGAAAHRCKEGGIDGIETVGGGHLIGQFVSPRTNLRTDGFGGSLANRCRFGIMVFEEMRRQVGDDFILGFRHVVDEGPSPGALSFADSLEIAHVFERSGFVDFFNALYGKFDTERALAVEYMPGMDSPIAPWLSVVSAFKKEVRLPVFHAARLSDIATARYAIREGLLDLVAMTRSHIADPHIVRKIEAGLEERIRPCVGATHCQSNFRPHCLHNPSTGREKHLPHVVARSPAPDRKVVIVGGGPGGLEAARISASRGHKVVLFEAANEVGGQVLLASRASWRRDLIGIIDWRRRELEHLGVDVRTGVYAGRSDVLAEDPDVVVIATGGIPDIDWLDGVEHITSVWDAIGGQVPLRQEVIVYDGTGRHPAPQIMEAACADGRQVQFVSIDALIAQELTYAERVTWKKRAYGCGASMLFDHELERVERQGNRLVATFRNVINLETVQRQADQVIVERGTIPALDVYNALVNDSTNEGVLDLDAVLNGQPQPKEGNQNNGFQLYRVGDAVASRNIHAAMLDATRLCQTL